VIVFSWAAERWFIRLWFFIYMIDSNSTNLKIRNLRLATDNYTSYFSQSNLQPGIFKLFFHSQFALPALYDNSIPVEFSDSSCFSDFDIILQIVLTMLFIILYKNILMKTLVILHTNCCLMRTYCEKVMKWSIELTCRQLRWMMRYVKVERLENLFHTLGSTHFKNK